jgi:hypothetical protein
VGKEEKRSLGKGLDVLIPESLGMMGLESAPETAVVAVEEHYIPEPVEIKPEAPPKEEAYLHQVKKAVATREAPKLEIIAEAPEEATKKERAGLLILGSILAAATGSGIAFIVSSWNGWATIF